MERHCSTGQSRQRAVAPTEEEEENALHVLNGLSVYHQELKTAYTATVYVKQLLLPAAIRDEMELHLIPDSSR